MSCRVPTCAVVCPDPLKGAAAKATPGDMCAKPGYPPCGAGRRAYTAAIQSLSAIQGFVKEQES